MVEDQAEVYNFQMTKNANYFVGILGLLVHNAKCKKPRANAVRPDGSEQRVLNPNNNKHKEFPKGDISEDPFWNRWDDVGKEYLDTAYGSTDIKQLYNYYKSDKYQNGIIVKFQPYNSGGWHPYRVIDTNIEVPNTVYKAMLNYGIITNIEYKKLIKNIF